MHLSILSKMWIKENWKSYHLSWNFFLSPKTHISWEKTKQKQKEFFMKPQTVKNDVILNNICVSIYVNCMYKFEICIKMKFGRYASKKGKRKHWNIVPPNMKPPSVFSIKFSKTTCLVFWKSFHKSKVGGRHSFWKNYLETDENIDLSLM